MANNTHDDDHINKMKKASDSDDDIYIYISIAVTQMMKI